MTLRNLFAAILLCLAVCAPAKAQSVLSASFCTNVQDNKCTPPPDPAGPVKLADLTADGGKGEKLYFWAALSNPYGRPVAIFILRDGPCSMDHLNLDGSALTRSANWYQTLENLVFSASPTEILSWLDIQSANLGPVDLQVTAASTSATGLYRVSTYRDLCGPGKVLARLFAPDGSPLPGPTFHAPMEIRVTN